MKEPAHAAASAPQQKLSTQSEVGLPPSNPAAIVQRQNAKDDVSIAISIVDDDAPARGKLADWIRRAQGFRCAGARGSGEAALATLPAEKPTVVLMVPGLSFCHLYRMLSV